MPTTDSHSAVGRHGHTTTKRGQPQRLAPRRCIVGSRNAFGPRTEWQGWAETRVTILRQYMPSTAQIGKAPGGGYTLPSSWSYSTRPPWRFSPLRTCPPTAPPRLPASTASAASA